MYLGGASDVLKYDGSTNIIPVAGEVTVYTRSFKMSFATFFGIWVKSLSTAGTPNIKVELEESYTTPTTEGSAETDLYVEPDGFDDIFSEINDALAHIKTISPVPMTYGRYKITGLTGNPADTVVYIKNFLQEQV
jgi:hypothetical protein